MYRGLGRFLELGIATLLILLLVGPNVGAQGAGVVIGVGEVGPSLDPHATVIIGAQPLYRAVFDSLTVVDHKGNLSPALAVSWRAVDDTTWEFKLRSGVKFSNGETITASDVKFSFDRVLNPNNNLPVRTRVTDISAVSIVDPLTVRITTTQPFGLLPKVIVVIPIISAKYFTSVGPDEFGRKPVGTGAFVLVDFERGLFARLRARTDSWRGVPRSRELVLRVIPEAAVRVAALKSREIDVAVDFPTDNVADLKASGFKVTTGKSARMMNLPFKCNPPLNDKRVRLALNYAVDKASIVRNIFQGMATVSQGQLVSPGATGFSSKAKAYPYDPKKAQSLMKEANLSQGFTLKLAWAPGRYLNDKAVVDAIMGYLSAIGVKGVSQG